MEACQGRDDFWIKADVTLFNLQIKRGKRLIMTHAFVILSALCKQGGNIRVFEHHMQRGATVIPCNTVESSFCIADTESLQSTNNEQQRNGLGVAWLDLGHGKQHTVQLEFSVLAMHAYPGYPCCMCKCRYLETAGGSASHAPLEAIHYACWKHTHTFSF